MMKIFEKKKSSPPSEERRDLPEGCWMTPQPRGHLLGPPTTGCVSCSSLLPPGGRCITLSLLLLFLSAKKCSTCYSMFRFSVSRLSEINSIVCASVCLNFVTVGAEKKRRSCCGNNLQGGSKRKKTWSNCSSFLSFS